MLTAWTRQLTLPPGVSRILGFYFGLVEIRGHSPLSAPVAARRRFLANHVCSQGGGVLIADRW